MDTKLIVSASPHVRSEETTQSLMANVIVALCPCVVASAIIFGVRALLVTAVSVVACVAFEWLYCKLLKKPNPISDLSAVVTGIILAMNVPVGMPIGQLIIGDLVAIIVVKQLFGGIGDNFLNPALLARAVLLASWPARMTGATAYALPTCWSGADAVTSATPLAGYEANTMDLFLGNIPGSIGEVCKAAILLGLIYLLVRRVISWRIPVTFLAVFAALSALVGQNVLNELLMGGVLFGAVFMATDYTTSPMNPRGQFIYAALCGVLVCVIRNFGAYPEGVTYAILIGNIVTPLIDKYDKPRLYGRLKKQKKEGIANA